MALPDFDVAYRLASPASRPPRSTEEEIREAFPDATKVRFLGAGAFGETWRVDDTAVKVIVADTFEEARVAREIAAASVNSPNVVSLRGTTELFAAGEDRVALIFGYVKGTDLATTISSRGVLPEQDLRDLAAGLLGGLDAMRVAGVIHRDVKPENVQLRMDSPRKPVILDLGLAYISEATSLTVYPAAVGTRAYMPPEVLRGERAVHRSDVYALGITLHIAATAKHPFLAEGEVVKRSELVRRIEHGAAFQISDTELGDLIVQMLHPQAFRRPSAARALNLLSS